MVDSSNRFGGNRALNLLTSFACCLRPSNRLTVVLHFFFSEKAQDKFESTFSNINQLKMFYQ